MCSWGNSGPKDIKRPRDPCCHFLKSQEQKQGTMCPLHTPPLEGWAEHVPSSLIPGHTPTLTPYKEPALLPHSSGDLGNLLRVFTLPCSWCRSTDKALAEFLVWPLVNFCWLGKFKHPGQYQRSLPKDTHILLVGLGSDPGLALKSQFTSSQLY